MSSYIHRHSHLNETIAAIATPAGEGGVAIVRISGKDAILIGAKVFSGPVESYLSHTLHFGKILSRSGQVIDTGLIAVMKAPKSYTGEDVVEIHCHGGSLLSQEVLQSVLDAGATAADPGEFTFRAFMNGKIDLVQAEAVQALISAKSNLALNAAEQQLQGALSQKILSFQKKLTDIASILEAWVDFPEEDIEFATQEELCETLQNLRQEIEELVQTFQDGRFLQEGVSICLIGRPNVGKSSLLNALVAHEKAIVSPIPGTTRDLIEEQIKLEGLTLKLIDTAGLRQTDEVIEQEGIRRTKGAIANSDLILFVVDQSQPLSLEEQENIATFDPEKTLLVWNKADLSPHRICEKLMPYSITISAKEGLNIDLLKKQIHQMIWKKGPPNQQEVLITQLRHKEALCASLTLLQQVIKGLQKGVSPEWLFSDLRQALKELGSIIGFDITEDILNAIFSKFCIGK